MVGRDVAFGGSEETRSTMGWGAEVDKVDTITVRGVHPDGVPSAAPGSAIGGKRGSSGVHRPAYAYFDACRTGLSNAGGTGAREAAVWCISVTVTVIPP